MATIFGFLHMGCTLALPEEYDWTIRVRRRNGLMSNYFDHLFSLYNIAIYSMSWSVLFSCSWFPCWLLFDAVLWFRDLEMVRKTRQRLPEDATCTSTSSPELDLMPGFNPTGKIVTLSVNSLQKCSRGHYTLYDSSDTQFDSRGAFSGQSTVVKIDFSWWFAFLRQNCQLISNQQYLISEIWYMRHNSVFASTMLQHYSRPISINDRPELLH